MKKKYVKQLRRIASELPGIERNIIGKEIVPGSKLLGDGVKEVEGKLVNELARYSKKSVIGKQPINHTRAMKKHFKKHGLAGVHAYVSAVENHIQQKNNQ